MLSETLQNLWNTKTHVLFFISCYLLYFFLLMNALVYVDIGQGIHYGKKVAQNEKHYVGFRIPLKRFAGTFHQVKSLISEVCL